MARHASTCIFSKPPGAKESLTTLHQLPADLLRTRSVLSMVEGSTYSMFIRGKNKRALKKAIVLTSWSCSKSSQVKSSPFKLQTPASIRPSIAKLWRPQLYNNGQCSKRGARNKTRDSLEESERTVHRGFFLEFSDLFSCGKPSETRRGSKRRPVGSNSRDNTQRRPSPVRRISHLVSFETSPS